MVEAAKEKGQELLERGKDVAERVAGSALDEARQQGLTPQVAGETISGLAGKVGEVARKAKQEAGAAMKESKLTPDTLKREASAAAGAASSRSEKPEHRNLTNRARANPDAILPQGRSSLSKLKGFIHPW